jgi:hypothetical protein
VSDTTHADLRLKLADATAAGDTPRDIHLLGGRYGTDLLAERDRYARTLTAHYLIPDDPREREVTGVADRRRRAMHRARRSFSDWWHTESRRYPMTERSARYMEAQRVWLLARGFSEEELPAT